VLAWRSENTVRWQFGSARRGLASVPAVGVNYDELRERSRAIWSLGNYPELARVLEPAARAVVEACGVSSGQEVLDVATGNGNAAMLAARRGAAVIALDLAPAMLELGRARAAEEGLPIEWVEGDAEELPFEDGGFDCVVSVFGAMLAPRPERAAAELFRVLRPGGTVGMANWTPEGFQGRVFAINNRHVPGPEGVPPSSEWGQEEVVAERFKGLAGQIRTERRTLPLEHESPEAMRTWFEENAGPAVAARRFLPAETNEAITSETLDLLHEFNRATDGSVAIDGEYLLVVARKNAE
jgi:SAM-dependent methyltransferase